MDKNMVQSDMPPPLPPKFIGVEAGEKLIYENVTKSNVPPPLPSKPICPETGAKGKALTFKEPEVDTTNNISEEQKIAGKKNFPTKSWLLENPKI